MRAWLVGLMLGSCVVGRVCVVRKVALADEADEADRHAAARLVPASWRMQPGKRRGVPSR